MKVFYQQYHVSVDTCFVDDMLAIGNEVIMPSDSMANGRISFYRSNIEHAHKPGVKIVSYEEYLALPPMAMVIPCSQLLDDFMKLYEARGRRDKIIYLGSLSIAQNLLPLDGAEFLISHDIHLHRISKAKYKMMYFSRPHMLINEVKDLRKSYDENNIKLYINNFFTPSFKDEREDANRFSFLWNRRIPFYGWDNPDGYLGMVDVQKNMLNSKFTLVFKKVETWGQMVLESMLLGTPCIFIKKYITSTFAEYLINPETAILGDSVEDVFYKASKLSFEEYENLSFEAKKQAEMFVEDKNRHDKLKWLFSKIIL